MEAEINTLTSTRVPRGLTELITLGRTLKRRAGDILAYFDHPHTSNGPTEAINGRLEHLRGSAPGLPQPHQLHHPLPPRNRRIQTPTTPSIMKSQQRDGRCTRYEPLHPLRSATPVTERDTRSEEVHCLQIGCAPNHKNKRGICETITDTHQAPGARSV